MPGAWIALNNNANAEDVVFCHKLAVSAHAFREETNTLGSVSMTAAGGDGDAVHKDRLLPVRILHRQQDLAIPAGEPDFDFPLVCGQIGLRIEGIFQRVGQNAAEHDLHGNFRGKICIYLEIHSSGFAPGSKGGQNIVEGIVGAISLQCGSVDVLGVSGDDFLGSFLVIRFDAQLQAVQHMPHIVAQDPDGLLVAGDGFNFPGLLIQNHAV